MLNLKILLPAWPYSYLPAAHTLLWLLERLSPVGLYSLDWYYESPFSLSNYTWWNYPGKYLISEDYLSLIFDSSLCIYFPNHNSCYYQKIPHPMAPIETASSLSKPGFYKFSPSTIPIPPTRLSLANIRRRPFRDINNHSSERYYPLTDHLSFTLFFNPLCPAYDSQVWSWNKRFLLSFIHWFGQSN